MSLIHLQLCILFLLILPHNHINVQQNDINIQLYLSFYYKFKSQQKTISMKKHSHNSPTHNKQSTKYNQLSTTFCSPPKIQKSHHVQNIIKKSINQSQPSHSLNHYKFIFKPQIHQLPFHIYPNQTQKKIQISKEQLRQQLFQDNTKTIQTRYQSKIKKQQQQSKNCTFHPKISIFSQQLAQSQLDNHQPIHQKLFNQASQLRQQKFQLQRKKKQQQHLQTLQLLNHKLQLPTKPKPLNTQKQNLKPIQYRIQQLLQHKIQSRKLLQQKYLHQQTSFHPQINPHSHLLAHKKLQRQHFKGNVVKRLMEQYSKSKKQKQNLKQYALLQTLKQCTFKPEINHNYHYQKNKYLPQNLQTSQKIPQLQFNTKQNFIPTINQLSSLIATQLRGTQDPQTKYQRLSTKPLTDKKRNIQQAQKQIYSNLTFHPKINQISSLIDIKATPRQHHCQLPQQQIHPYQPKINWKSRLARAESLQVGRLRMKKRQLQYKLSSQYQQLRECNFKPKINNKRHTDQRTICQVQGIDRYIDLQQKSRAKTSQLKKRQSQVFHLELRYDQRRNKS